MKVLATAALAATFVFFALPNDASAQALGVGVYGDSEVEELGLGANFVFHTGGVVDNSRAGIDLKYWLVDGGTYMTGNIDGQYLWFKGPTALSYGLVGLNVTVIRRIAKLSNTNISKKKCLGRAPLLILLLLLSSVDLHCWRYRCCRFRSG